MNLREARLYALGLVADFKPKVIPMSKLNPGDIFSYRLNPVFSEKPDGYRLYILLCGNPVFEMNSVILSLVRGEVCPQEPRSGRVWRWGEITLTRDYRTAFQEIFYLSGSNKFLKPTGGRIEL